jgi:1,4-dihydroxy-2-naphthoate polyprenyltransferase
MNGIGPGFIKMVRAPFFSSIISPLLLGTWTAYAVTGRFDGINFLTVLVLGICLHMATNVYNDIYDTLQGTDRVNVHRNEFSGGSGVLVENPNALSTMYRIARIGLLGALLATLLLFFRVQANQRPLLIVLLLISTFLSKYYTAEPIKLASRGWGEFAVWFAFGPMAVLMAAVSQNVSFHNLVYVAMPIPGLSTLSILLIGQMIDAPADQMTGKRGVAVRLGNKITGRIYTAVQLILCTNVILLAALNPGHGLFSLLSLIPYLLLLPRILKILLPNYDNPQSLKQAAGLNVLLHLTFSLSLIISLVLSVVV